ncbi:SH3 domain-containing protein Dlish-like [Tachypleus tridentatus]|uniref:SH3 domain-containing protein Dlish-like n=1 Tax=Tachypleus tridentatus TaxID=6853 RepID=UPI003FD3C9C5
MHPPQSINNNNHLPSSGVTEDLWFHGSESVMLYDYKAQAPDDLSVQRGDWVYADLNNQTVDGWIWACALKMRKYGFIPKAYARPPAMTSL